MGCRLRAALHVTQGETRPLLVDHLFTNLVYRCRSGVHFPCFLAVAMYPAVCPRSAVCVNYNPCFEPDQIVWLRELRVSWQICSQSVTFVQWQVLLVPPCVAVLNACKLKQRWRAPGAQLLYIEMSCTLHGGVISSRRWEILLM